MLGDFEPAEGFALAKQYFETIPPQPKLPHADVSEPAQTEERTGVVEEKFGPLPAIAIGYTLPPRESPDWYVAGILDRVLHGGRAGRVYRKLVLDEQIAVDVNSTADLFDTNGPTQMVTSIYHKPEFTSEGTIAIFDEVIEEIQQKGIALDELDPVKVKFRSDYYSALEGGMGYSMPRFGLMHYLACFTLFDGDPHRVNTILDGFLAVTPEQVQAFARKYLVARNRAVVVRRPVAPGGAR
jgi:predicted Zn-dependent peptidase